MSDKPDLAERIGTAINELDIDFSSFTVVGWLVSLVSLAIGGGIAYLVANGLVERNGLDLAAGMAFCFTMLAVTTITFLMLRWVTNLIGKPITKQKPE